MAEYGKSNSIGENNRNKREYPTRKEYSDKYIGQLISEKNAQETQKKNREHYGSGKYIEEGTNHRLAGIPYSPREEILKSIDDERSYFYGYYEKGTRTLAVKIAYNKLLEDGIYLIGYNDGQDENIIFESLPEEIKTNEYYIAGFEQGLKKNKRGVL